MIYVHVTISTLQQSRVSKPKQKTVNTSCNSLRLFCSHAQSEVCLHKLKTVVKLSVHANSRIQMQKAVCKNRDKGILLHICIINALTEFKTNTKMISKRRHCVKRNEIM